MNILATASRLVYPYSFCHCCGTRYTMTTWPRKCLEEDCGDVRWHNPTPIGVLLQTVTDGKRIGILTPIRGHAPQRGLPGLVGGFSEAMDDGADDTAMREYVEEIRLKNQNRGNIQLHVSRGSGPMEPPGKRQELTFAINHEPLHVDDFEGWEPDAETLAIEFSWGPRVLAFPTHTFALATYFKDHLGMDVPAAYLDQPKTGQEIHAGADVLDIADVAYPQPRLDKGLWMVETQHKGLVAVRREGADWRLVDGAE